MKRALILSAAFVLLAAITAFFMLAGPALAVEPWEETPDSQAIQAICQRAGSPLPWWTIAAFACSHPGFDCAGFLALLTAESSLGRACDYKCNPGSIKGGPVGSLWRDLRIGVSPRGYNVYPDLRAGTRAAIRLIDAWYAETLRKRDWVGFAKKYFGDKPGWYTYRYTLQQVHSQLVREANAHGVEW